MRTAVLAALTLSFLVPAEALAAGSHQQVGCTGCHRIARNARVRNPATGQTYAGAAAMCLACHEEEANGGKGHLPISQHVSHPLELVAVDAKVASVPGALLQGGGRFDCLSCHDPHPSNPNFQYLRLDVGARGERMDHLCALCHPAKADPSARGADLGRKDPGAAGEPVRPARH